jgi:hypothetical protein
MAVERAQADQPPAAPSSPDGLLRRASDRLTPNADCDESRVIGQAPFCMASLPPVQAAAECG